MRPRTLAVALGLVLAAATPALAQRGDRGDRGGAAQAAAAGNWELIGEERVGFGVDRDVITLPHNEDHYRNKSYRRLRFVAEGGDIRLRSIKLVYLNGHTEDLQVGQTLSSGQNLDVDLRGERSFLKQIEMVYGSRFGLTVGDRGVRMNLAKVKVYGDNARGIETPAPKPPPSLRGWDTLAQQAFDRRNDRVEIKVGRREGRLGQIALYLDGERISVREVRVRFGNGQTQTFRFTQELEPGVLSSPIDLAGEQRFIDTVTVFMNPGRRFGNAQITLLGTERPGGVPGVGSDLVKPSWVPLGRQVVGFRTDRDVIRVGQSEEWFRNRGFDKLHFIVTNNDVEMGNLRITYLNGHVENVPVNGLLRAGTDTAVDLPGRRSYLREIEMTYRTRPNFRTNRAEVSVFGEPVEWRR